MLRTVMDHVVLMLTSINFCGRLNFYKVAKSDKKYHSIYINGKTIYKWKPHKEVLW